MSIHCSNWLLLTAALVGVASACSVEYGGGNNGGGDGGNGSELTNQEDGDGPESMHIGKQASALVATDTLSWYANKCDLAVGVTVPSFDCDDAVGTTVPATFFGVPYFGGGFCDRPDQLHQDCDPGSRFRVLVDTASTSIVAALSKAGVDYYRGVPRHRGHSTQQEHGGDVLLPGARR